MLNVSKEFLDTITSNVRFREMKKIEVSDTEDFASSYFIDNEIKNIELKLQGRLFYTNMTQLNVEIIGNHDLQGKFFKYYRGVIPIDDIEQEYWADYGIFRVNKVDYEDDTDTTKLMAHDLMLKTMQQYNSEDMDITYPISVKTLLERVSSVVGLDLRTQPQNLIKNDFSDPSIIIIDDTSINFPNMNYIIDKDLYINREVTYREILDEICNLAGSSMRIKDNKLYLHQFEETSLTLSQNLASSMEIGEKIGKFNVLNLAREPQNDNYPYPLDFNNIPEKDRVEFIFSNNELINNDRVTLAPLIFPLINNFDYYTFNHNAQGYGIFNVGDIVTLEDLKGNKYNSIVTDQNYKFKGMVISETESKVLSNLKPEYSKPNQLQQLGREMYFIVDQQNGVIEGLINDVGELTDETASLTIRVDSIETQVSTVNLGNIIGNANGSEGYAGWEGKGILLGVNDLIGYPDLTSKMTAIPKFIAGSLSEFGWEFFTSGQMISTYGYISDTQYSFKAKIGNFKPCIITVYEYKADKSANGTIVKQFNNPQSYIQFTEDLKSDTVYARLGIEFPTATPNSRPNISEIMYNKGEPKDWFETPLDAIMFAESSRRQLSNRITDTVTEIDKVSGDIHNTMVDITAKDGVVIKNNNGKGLTILNDNDEEVISLNANGDIISLKMTALDMVTENMKATNAQVEGEITATSGKIGGYNIEGDSLVGNDVTLGQNEIKIGETYLRAEVISGAPNTLSIDSNYINIGRETGRLYFGKQMFLSKTTQFGIWIGSPSDRVNSLYLKNQPDVSSDTRYKKNILPISDKFINIFGKEVKPKTYVIDGKKHFGYIAQDVERALYKYTLSKYGLNEAKNVVSEFAVLSKSESYMSLLYGEIAVIMDAYNRRRMDKLEKRIEALEREIK